MSNETLPAEWRTAPQPASLKEVEMEGRKKITVGSKVKIKHQHWLRALEEGVVVEYRPRAIAGWCNSSTAIRAAASTAINSTLPKETF